MPELISMDDQPISATFFGEGKWLTDFITPNAIDVKKLHENITQGISGLEARITTCWKWVANNVSYKKFVQGKLWVNGKLSIQNDLWNLPAITAHTGIGNCANKSFLLTSLLRNELSSNEVHCVLGNLYNGKPGGHAWVQVKLGEQEYIIESTRPDVQALVPAHAAERYEAVHLFNDKVAYAVEGRTVLEPFTACFSTWLKDYLDMAFIEGAKG